MGSNTQEVSGKTCLNCHYIRAATDIDEPEKCPSCGAYYSKMEASQKSKSSSSEQKARSSSVNTGTDSENDSLSKRDFKKEYVRKFDREPTALELEVFIEKVKEGELGKKVLINIFIVLFFLSLVIVIWPEGEPSKEEVRRTTYEKLYGTEDGAWAYMQLFVEKSLKNPDSADFPFDGISNVTNLGNGEYRVRSYVDATNSYGATIRTHFTGKIKRVEEGWRLISLDMNK